MPDIITIGSATRDVFLLSKEFQVINSPQFATGQAECVTLGAKIDVEECVLSTGGGATNAAVTFAKLGFSTSVITRIGDDAPGASVLTDLSVAGVDTSLVKKVKNGKTAYSTLLTTQNGERTALVYRGVSSTFALADVPWKTLSAKWLYVSSLSGNLELLEHLLSTAKKLNIKTAVNPGGGELEKPALLRPILGDADVILLNLEEAQKYTGSATKDGKELAGMIAKGNAIAVVTDGSRGAYAAQGKQRYYAKNRLIKSISRTGAGDAFGSGFIAALAKGETIDNALKIGTLNAESVIQHVGAKAGVLTKWPKAKELEEIKVFVSK